MCTFGLGPTQPNLLGLQQRNRYGIFQLSLFLKVSAPPPPQISAALIARKREAEFKARQQQEQIKRQVRKRCAKDWWFEKKKGFYNIRVDL